MSKRPGGVTFAGWLVGINGAFLSLGDVVIVAGLWGTPGAQEFFRSPTAIARPAPPSVPPRPG
jgi:hypothetical protein